MNQIQIKVSSIKNYIQNGKFENWIENDGDPDIPSFWDSEYNYGDINAWYSLDGLAVKISHGNTNVGAGDFAYIRQEIDLSDLDDGTNVTVRCYHKGLGVMWFYRSNGSTRITALDTSFTYGVGTIPTWEFTELSFDIDKVTWGESMWIRFQTVDSFDDDREILYVDNVSFSETNWSDDKLPLDTDEVRNIENFQRAIEDDLFTFKSDAISFEVRNYVAKTGYFTPDDFIINSERIFRFDIEIDYYDGDDIHIKKMVLFSNNDSIKRTQKADGDTKTDRIVVQLYELSSLFKDNGWFIGELLSDETDEKEKAYYLYTTESNTSRDELLEDIKNKTEEIINRNLIPVEDFEIDFTVSTSGKITINFPQISTADSGFTVIDYVYTPNNRFFILTCPTPDLGSTGSMNLCKIYEIINGSTLSDTGINIDAILDLAANTGVGYTQGIGFVHTYNNDYFGSSDDKIEFIIYDIKYWGVSLDYYSGSYVYYEYDVDTPNRLHMGAISSFVEGSSLIFASTFAKTIKGLYLDTDGDLYYPSYATALDNMLWIEEHPTDDTLHGTFTFGEITQQSGYLNSVTATSYAQSMIGELDRFIEYFDLFGITALQDLTFGGLIKEFCITQDSIWYLDYIAGIDITLKIVGRAETDTSSAILISDNDIMTLDTNVKKITFGDLRSQIFNQDTERMRNLLGYYNAKYGGGKQELDMVMFGYFDWELGDVKRYGKDYYFIKAIEFENDRHRMYAKLFQVESA